MLRASSTPSPIMMGLLLSIPLASAALVSAQAVLEIDLLTQSTATDLRRVYGSEGSGAWGLPVAGGLDVDGDTLPDYAVASMVASPLARAAAGLVYLIFGDGTVAGTLDTATVQAGILRIAGAGIQEHAGSEIWIDDVTGDGLADLLLCRQDHSPAGRIGAGALTILAGGVAVRTFADTLQILDLDAPPPSPVTTTIVGAEAGDRLGIWVRTGDVDGDGIGDLVVGADRREHAGYFGLNHGSAYVVRGGAHLASGMSYDLADLGELNFGLATLVAELRPPAPANNFHFGATVQIADLDGNGRGEVLVAAALSRAGASLAPAGGSGKGSGGPLDGTLFIAWDDLFPPTPWPSSLLLDVTGPATTRINGSQANVTFGEEILGGLDYDGDGDADLFVGDLVGAGLNGATSGIGDVFWDAADLKGLDFDMQTPPGSLSITRFHGPQAGSIGADTAAHGDFDGDGIDDLAFSSPHDHPFGRASAGTVHVFFGRPGGWPGVIDLAPGNLPCPSEVRVTAVYGGHATNGGDRGDTLSYSAAAGDIDGDGKTDLITNEMIGNGVLPGAVDVGNLIVVSGRSLSAGILFPDGFESGDISCWANGGTRRQGWQRQRLIPWRTTPLRTTGGRP